MMIPHNASSKGRDRIAAGAIAAMTLLAYLPAMRAGFVFDDFAYLHDNPTLTGLGGLRAIWFDLRALSQYYPMVFTTFWIEHQLWGLNPAGYHAVNILLHAANAILVWLVLRRLAVPGAWLAAAIFAVHPVHVESVAWVAERKNVLSTLFYLLAALAYLRFATIRGPVDESKVAESPWGWYGAAVLLFAAALLSKTITCTFPAAILLVLWWKRGRLGWRDVAPLLPLFAMAIAAGLITTWAEKHMSGARGELYAFTLPERCLIAGRALWFYLYKLVWPTHLSFIYPRWNVDVHSWSQYLFPLAAILVPLVLLAARRVIGRGPAAACLFFWGTMLPVLGFVNIAFMRLSFVADHFVYLADIGIIALFAAGLTRILNRTTPPDGPPSGTSTGRPARSTRAVTVAILGVLTVLTWRQATYYMTAESLWRHTLAANPDSPEVCSNLSESCVDLGHADEAVLYAERALRLRPDYPEAWINLGNGLHLQGRADEAVAAFRKAIEIDPRGAMAYNNLGNVLIDLGRADEAVTPLLKAIELSPNLAIAYNNLGRAQVARGHLDEAIAAFRKAIECSPGLSQAQRNLALAMKQKMEREGGSRPSPSDLP
ncbi:MAG TPA: tetratricopeptide repeat protein [Phycisphaerae bacterium]|nr:tetratricopeptide repeat protein [Phycisphaerae bacterium]